MLKSMRILTKLRRHQNAYPFNVPVDTRLVPNYLSIIRGTHWITQNPWTYPQ